MEKETRFSQKLFNVKHEKRKYLDIERSNFTNEKSSPTMNVSRGLCVKTIVSTLLSHCSYNRFAIRFQYMKGFLQKTSRNGYAIVLDIA